MLEMSAFKSLYGGQFTLSTQLIKPIKLKLSRYTSHQRSTTVSLETYPSDQTHLVCPWRIQGNLEGEYCNLHEVIKHFFSYSSYPYNFVSFPCRRKFERAS